jgi:hypothetical protein
MQTLGLFLDFTFCFGSLQTTTNANSITQNPWRCCYTGVSPLIIDIFNGFANELCILVFAKKILKTSIQRFGK